MTFFNKNDCFESFIAQTYENIELTVVDDCSTDSSWEIIQAEQGRLEARFKRVLLHRNPENMDITHKA